jgi:hypothetical protein
VGGREAVERREFEFFGEDDLAVELVDRLSPCVWAERVVVDAQTAPFLTLVLGSRREKRKDGLPLGRGLALVARGRTRGRADEPRVEFVLPFPEKAFPDETADIRVVDGISEV